MTLDQYLRGVLARRAVDTSLYSPVRGVQATLAPVLQSWAGRFLVEMKPSGSFAKGTAVHGGTDIDIFVSLSSSLDWSLERIYDSMLAELSKAGYATRRQNVSIGITVDGYSVDVTPARRQAQNGNYHSLWSNKTKGWLQTNVNEHCRVVSVSGRLEEIRLIKIWRNRYALDWPSFYLELFVIDALIGARQGALETNISTVFRAIANSIATRRLIDPSNTNNVVSDTLTAQGKTAVANGGRSALSTQWTAVFQ